MLFNIPCHHLHSQLLSVCILLKDKLQVHPQVTLSLVTLSLPLNPLLDPPLLEVELLVEKVCSLCR